MSITSPPISAAESNPPYTWLDGIEFIMEIEDRWHLTIPDEKAVEQRSLRSFSRYVADALGMAGKTSDANAILTEILVIASRHFAIVSITPDFDPVAMLCGDVSVSVASAPYFRKLERKYQLKSLVRDFGRAAAKFLALTAYCALFVTGVRLMIAQDIHLAAIGCVVFLLALQLPYIVMWAIWYRRDNRLGKYGNARLIRKSAIVNRK
jgi:hypothetical protein